MLFKSFILLLLLSSYFLFSQVTDSLPNLWITNKLDKPKPYSELVPGKYFGPKPIVRNSEDVTAIMIHSTKGFNVNKYIKMSWKNGWNVHFVIDKNGNLYGDPNAPIHIYPTARGLDPVAIHIALEGESFNLIENSIQWNQLQLIINVLVKEFNIPKNNHDITSNKGIFTHNQSKKRYGGFIDLVEHGDENVLAKLLQDINGKYYREILWKGRFNPEWVFRMEDRKAIKSKFRPDRGRDITPTPIANLKNIEKDQSGNTIESYRIQYEHRGVITPSCVVLHYTASQSFETSLLTMEDRNLTASIMVDKDGKAYQLLDSLEDKPATAFGTNDNCIQIEIVGKNTQDLMKNKLQTKKVVKLVKELSKKYKFPLNNHQIESFKGVYSHTQAKKKFGGSSFLIGTDFDPGEEYMARILNLAGGKFFPEKKWYNRKSIDWVIIDREFQP